MQTLRGTKREFGKLHCSPIIDHEMRGVRKVMFAEKWLILKYRRKWFYYRFSLFFLPVKWISIDRSILEILLQRIVDLSEKCTRVWRGDWLLWLIDDHSENVLHIYIYHCIIINYILCIIILLFLDCFNLHFTIFHLNLIFHKRH